jgi:hypothetical protein
VNRYVELKRAFQFLECVTRQKDLRSRCRDLPPFLDGRRAETSLRDYLLCLMLVSTVAQLEADIERLEGIPGLRAANGLLARLRILREHHQIPGDVFDAVDRIRDARNRFVHQGELPVDPGCTKAEVPRIIVRFLQRCHHPDFP